MCIFPDHHKFVYLSKGVHSPESSQDLFLALSLFSFISLIRILSLFQVISCVHIFCKSCLSSLPSSSCPLCSKPLTVDFTGKKKSEAKSSILDRIKIENFQSSTKIEALVS